MAYYFAHQNYCFLTFSLTCSEFWAQLLEAWLALKPGLHVRRKHKNKHKHKHKDVYTCDKHKHNVTHASAEANKFGAIAQPGCLLARDLIPTWRKMATHE